VIPPPAYPTQLARTIGYMPAPLAAGPFLAVASWLTEGASVAVWNVDEGTLTRTFHVGLGIFGVAVSPPHGKYLAARRGGVNGTIHVWDRATGKTIPPGPLNPQLDAVHAVSFSPDGAHLACACHSGVAVYRTSSLCAAR
jgi:WD40 repeat protein